MRRMALVIALSLVSGFSLLMFLARPGMAQSARVGQDIQTAGVSFSPGASSPDSARQETSLSTSSPTTLIFQQGISPTASYAGAADTYISIDSPTANPGQENLLGLYHDHRQKTLIRFDLTEVPRSAIVSSARLEMHTFRRETSDYTDVGTFRVLRSWTENGGSWNNATAAEPWRVAGCDGSGDRSFELVAMTRFLFGETWQVWKTPLWLHWCKTG